MIYKIWKSSSMFFFKKPYLFFNSRVHVQPYQKARDSLGAGLKEISTVIADLCKPVMIDGQL